MDGKGRDDLFLELACGHVNVARDETVRISQLIAYLKKPSMRRCEGQGVELNFKSPASFEHFGIQDRGCSLAKPWQYVVSQIAASSRM